jgi:transposase-like protein
VKLVAEGKQLAPEKSSSLGIGESTLYKWIDQLKPMGEKDSKSIKVNDELTRLRSELVELNKKLALAEAHREILTKARGYKVGQSGSEAQHSRLLLCWASFYSAQPTVLGKTNYIG